MTEKPINAGDFKHRITIVSIVKTEDSKGFPVETETVVLSAKAKIKTTKGFTLIANDTDFEKAYTNFTIRWQNVVEITREMFVRYRSKLYSIEYLNNIDETDTELEMQCKEVTK